MANKKRAENQRGTLSRQSPGQGSWQSRENDDSRYRERYTENGQFENPDRYPSQRYDRRMQEPYGFQENRRANFGDDFGHPNSNYNWQHEEEQYRQDRFQRGNRRQNNYPGAVDGNRNESRGEGYGGFGHQRNGDHSRGERYNDEDRFYNDRGYSRDMYAPNDRSVNRDDTYRHDERGNSRYQDGNWDSRVNYEDRSGHNHFPRDRYDNENRDQYRDERIQDGRPQWNWREENNAHPGKQRVVGRGMYGNNPSGRYGSYGDDTMHGNMGGGTWQGNNEYQVGGGVGYQRSDAGTYGSLSGEPGNWDEDQPPGRKIAATRGSTKNSNKNKQGNKSIAKRAPSRTTTVKNKKNKP